MSRLPNTTRSGGNEVERFRDGRIARIVAGETPISLPDRPKVVLHLLPIAALDPTTRIDVGPLQRQTAQLSPINPGDGWSSRFNLDGFLTHGEAGTPRVPVSYLQVFRSGTLEAVESRMLHSNNDHDIRSGHEPQNLIGSAGCERMLIVALDKFLKVEMGLGMEPPIVVMLSLVGVRGYGLVTSDDFRMHRPYRFDRDVLLLPEAIMEDFDEAADKLLQPAFDAMWQAAGYERCLHYGEKQSRWSDTMDGRPPI